MVGWGLGVLNLVVCERWMMPRGSSSPRMKRVVGNYRCWREPSRETSASVGFYSLCVQKCLTTHVSPSATSSMVPS